MKFVLFCFAICLTALMPQLGWGDELEDAIRIFEGDDNGPSESPPPSITPPKSDVPISPLLKASLESLAEEEKALRAKYEEFMKPKREEFAKAVLTWPAGTTPAASATLISLAEMARKGTLPRRDIRYDLARIGGDWDWEYGRYMVLLPDGQFRYHGKIRGRWEWLDYERGSIAIHWINGGCIMNVGPRIKVPSMMTSLWWGHNKVPRKDVKHPAGSPEEQPPAFTPTLQAKLNLLVKQETEALGKLHEQLNAARQRKLAEVMNEVKNAPLSAAEKAAKEADRLKVRAGDLQGADQLAGTWLLPGVGGVSFLPNGTLKTSSGLGKWEWAGDRGGQFFVVLPSKKGCMLCRFSKSNPDALRVIDDNGNKVEALRQK